MLFVIVALRVVASPPTPPRLGVSHAEKQTLTITWPATNTGFVLQAARAPVASDGSPGTWMKYYHGSWSEPGIGDYIFVTPGQPAGVIGQAGYVLYAHTDSKGLNLSRRLWCCHRQTGENCRVGLG
jgi:hypothetical protein